MAPWCPACRSFQTTWQSLAEWSRDLDINVGVVDVTENPGMFKFDGVITLITVIELSTTLYNQSSVHGPCLVNNFCSAFVGYHCYHYHIISIV